MISVDWVTRIIFVPQSYLTLISGDKYLFDVNQFRLDLNDLEDDPLEGLVHPDTHRHNTEADLGGVTYARQVEIINGYTVTFESGDYKIVFTGANNNVADVVNVDGLVLEVANSAGLIVAPSTVTADDVWSFDLSGMTASQRLLSTEANVDTVIDILCNNATTVNNGDGSRTVTLFEDDGTTIRAQVLISADGLTRTRIV